MNWTSEMATFQNKKGMAFGFEFRLMFHRTSEKKKESWQVAARSRNRFALCHAENANQIKKSILVGYM
jgi:hypothetical protein